MISFLTGAGDLTTAAPNTNGIDINIAKPANIADGDLLIAVVAFQNSNVPSPAITAPAGWNRLGPGIPSNPLRPGGIYVLPVPSAASVTETSWTWSTNVDPGRRRGMIYRARGVNLSDPLDASGTWSAATGTSSVVLPGLTAATTGAALLTMAYSQSSAGTGYPNYTPPSPMQTLALVNTPDTGQSNTALWSGYEMVQPGATGSRTISISPAAANSGGYMIALKAADSAPAPVLTHNIAGDVSATGFQIAFKAQNITTGVRAVVSLAQNLSNPIYSSSTMPDSAGYGHLTISGLSADTQYYWGLELDGQLSSDYRGETRTYPAVGERVSFSFVTGSCVNTGANPITYDNMRARTGINGGKARFFAHLGDFHYVYSSSGGNPIAPADQTILSQNYASQIAQSRQHLMYRTIPLTYTWSDIDSFGSNSDGTYAANASANASYRQVFPVPGDMPQTSGIYRTWAIGRIRFIQSDMRTFASARGATDNASKTKLGSAQHAWMLNIIQSSPEKVIVWLGDSAWYGPASTTGTNDGWEAYNNERTQLGAAIAATGKNIIYIHGDTHTLAADNGTNNQWGGFPIVSAAPMLRPDMNPWPTGPGWTLSNGSFPSSTQAGTAYGWFDVEDTGNTISIDFKGFNNEVQQVSMKVTWFVGRYYKGDGTRLRPQVLINGTLQELA